MSMNLYNHIMFLEDAVYFIFFFLHHGDAPEACPGSSVKFSAGVKIKYNN